MDGSIHLSRRGPDWLGLRALKGATVVTDRLDYRKQALSTARRPETSETTLAGLFMSL